MKKILSLVLTAVLLFGSFLPGISSLSYAESNNEVEDENLELLTLDIEKRYLDDESLIKLHDQDENLRVIVKLKGNSLGDELKLKEKKISTASVNDISLVKDNIELQQNNVINSIKRVGVKLDVDLRFNVLINGFSADVKYSEISKILAIPDVEDVYIAETYSIPEYIPENVKEGNPDLTGVQNTWDLGYKGEGQLVSIIDSGIDVNHKDMKITDINNAKIKDNFKYNNKVPYGYNWSEDNDNIKDKAVVNFAHGMHVAGIVAGNGEYKGVAPEAQLIGQKIFPNDSRQYAQTDVLIKAIEDSVLHGADVVNMSLGARSGFVDSSNPLHIAIQKAIDQGITFAIAAGNDGISTNPLPAYSDNPDTATLGNPGTVKDAITVASFESSKITRKVIDYETTDSSGKIPYMNSNNDISPEEVLAGGKYSIVNCGRGEYSDFPVNLEGRIALIENKDFSFDWPVRYAVNKGAVGVIFYNQPEYDDIMEIGIYDSDIDIPVVLVSSKDGNTLRSIISDRGKVSFNGDIVQLDSPNVGQISAFSSWGPNPDLSFKPNILAPGGNIWSTVNNDEYTNMSGTSMASPHVAGAIALVNQYLEENQSNLKGKDRVINIKNRIMSTAKPVMPPNYEQQVEYSPRQQGAGLINIDKAIKTNAIVTSDNGVNGVELGSIGNKKDFNINVENFGNEALTFEINASKVITDGKGSLPEEFDTEEYHFPRDKEYNTLKPVEIEGATVDINEKEITVEPGETKKITISLDIPSTVKYNIFTDGFIYLNSKTEGQPNLVIPYIGFFGDWDKLNVVDPQAGTEDAYYNFTCLCSKIYDPTTMLEHNLILGSYDDEDGKMSINNDLVSFAPQGWHRINYRYLIPVVSLLRNAQDLEISVLDEEQNLLRTYVKDRLLRKSGWLVKAPFYVTSERWIWDGLLYNTKIGYMEYAPDGQYFIQVKTRPEGSDVWQELKLPVKVDNHGPKVKITSERPIPGQKDYKLTWEAEDELTDIDFIVIQSDADTIATLDGSAREYTLDTNETGLTTLQVRAYDYALNYSSDFINYGEPEMPEDEPIRPYAPARLEIISDYKINFEAQYSTPINKRNEQLATWDKLSYKLINEDEEVVLQREYDGNNQKNFYIQETETIEKDGKYKVIYEGLDSLGNHYEDIRTIFVDTTPPEIVFNNVDSSGTIIVPSDLDEYTLEGVISDNLTGTFLWINGEPVVEEDFDYVAIDPIPFAYTVHLNDGTNVIQVQAGDSANNRINTTVTITKSDVQNGPKLTIIEPENYSITNESNITIRGKVEKFNDNDIEGVFINDEAIELNEDGTFEKTIELLEGENIITVKAIDVEGNITIRNIFVKCEIEKPQEGLPIGELPTNTVIVGDEAFDIRYLNNNSVAQKKLIKWYSENNPVYIKLNASTIVDIKGTVVDESVLPDLLYFDEDGNTAKYIGK